MKLRELLPLIDGCSIRVNAHGCHYDRDVVFTTSISAEQACAKYLDWEVYSIKIAGRDTRRLCLDIIVKEYHAHL